MMLNSVFRRYGELRFVVLLLREHLRMPGKDLSQITLSRWGKFCFAMLDLSRRWGLDAPYLGESSAHGELKKRMP